MPDNSGQWGRDGVLRSVRRYLALLLAEFPGPAGRAWEIRLARGIVTDQQRPLGVLEALPKTPGRGRSSVPQGTVVDSMALVFTGYPALLTGGRAVIDGALVANRIADALDDLIRHGLDTITFANGRRAAGPERLPLWNYNGVPVAGAAGPAAPHNLLVAESWSTRTIQDPVDEARFTVALNLTVSWERPGRILPPSPPVTSMPGTYATQP